MQYTWQLALGASPRSHAISITYNPLTAFLYNGRYCNVYIITLGHLLATHKVGTNTHLCYLLLNLFFGQSLWAVHNTELFTIEHA